MLTFNFGAYSTDVKFKLKNLQVSTNDSSRGDFMHNSYGLAIVAYYNSFSLTVIPYFRIIPPIIITITFQEQQIFSRYIYKAQFWSGIAMMSDLKQTDLSSLLHT